MSRQDDLITNGAAGYARGGRRVGRIASQAMLGIICGGFGYLLGVWVFVYEGLFTGQADPGDQLAAGLAGALLVGAVTTVAGAVSAFRTRKRQPVRSVGVVVGMVAGLLILTNLFLVVKPVMDDLPGTCGCDPLIQQLRPDGG